MFLFKAALGPDFQLNRQIIIKFTHFSSSERVKCEFVLVKIFHTSTKLSTEYLKPISEGCESRYGNLSAVNTLRTNLAEQY